MRALTFKQIGPIETVELSTIAKQKPGKGEVLIRLTSAGLNRADTLWPEGRYFFKPQFYCPKTEEVVSESNSNAHYCRLGFEGAGIIDEIGPEVNYNVGDRVAITPLALDVSRQGCIAEYGIYNASTLIPTPDTITDEDAASIWMQYLTAYGGLVIEGGLKKGQTVVITAASSSVGVAAIQVANMLGAVSIATTTSAEKVDRLKQLGAQHVINMNNDNYVEQIELLTHGTGTDLVFDAVAGPDTRYLIQGSAKGGKIIIQGMLDRRPMDIHAGVLMKRLLTLKGFTLDTVLDNPKILEQCVEQISIGIANNKLTPVIAQKFKLDEFKSAFSLLKSNKHTGKILITP